MAITLDGTLGITSPAETVQGALTTTGNTILGDASTDTLNVGNGGLVKDASGNVGIGTSSPTSRLQIGDATVNTNNGIILGKYNAASEANLPAIRQISAGTGNDLAIAATSGSGVIRFYTGGANSSLALGTANNAERMNINSAGDLLVGKVVDGTTAGFEFSPSWWAANTGHALVSGNSLSNSQQALSVYTTSSSQYQFYVGYGGTVYARSASITTLSDISEKENIKDLETGIGTVLALKPRRFDWKNGSGKNIAGFIAQEVQSVLPDLVESFRVSEDETKLGLKTGDMIPTLVKAIQELKAIVDAQAVRIAALES